MTVEYSIYVSGLRWMCCEDGVALYVKCTNVGLKW